MSLIDAVALAQTLMRIDTAGPEAREEAAIGLLARLLGEAGFATESHAFAAGRPSLLARHEGGQGLPVVLSGHLDTVPVGAAAWRYPPLGADVHGGLLHGRGSADMKGGIAALVAAAIAVAEAGTAAQPIVLALTAGEEIGCLGAIELARIGRLPRAAGVVVAEPTGNRLALGHRGALWLRADYQGRSAHGSTPHLGHNAIYDAAEGIRRCSAFAVDDSDPLLGRVTVNVGTVTGGLNINSVPDLASFTLDIRSVVPGTHPRLRTMIGETLGQKAVLSTLIDLPAVRTRADDRFAVRVAHAVSIDQPRAQPIAVPFFTDASILSDACAAPSVILGPGEPEMAHQTNECCPTDQIRDATGIYERLLTTVS